MTKLNLFCFCFALWALVTAGALALRDAHKNAVVNHSDAADASLPMAPPKPEPPVKSRPLVRIVHGRKVRIAVPTCRSVTMAENFNNPWVVVKKPEEAVDGDLLLCFLISTENAVTPPPGWRLIRRQADMASTLFTYTYWKKALGEGADYRWNVGRNWGSTAVVGAWKNVDLSSPVVANAGSASGYTTLAEAPSLQSARANSLLVCFWAIANSRNLTPPPRMTLQHQSIGPNGSLSVADRILLTPGAAGAQTARAYSGVGNQTASQSLILAPAIQSLERSHA